MLLKCADRVFRFLMLLFGDEHSEKHRLISKYAVPAGVISLTAAILLTAISLGDAHGD